MLFISDFPYILQDADFVKIRDMNHKSRWCCNPIWNLINDLLENHLSKHKNKETLIGMTSGFDSTLSACMGLFCVN